MFAFLLTLLIFGCVLKVTGWMIKICGKLIGFFFGLIGYMILGVIAVSVLGIAMAFVPVIIVLGIIGLVLLVCGAFSKV